MVDKESLITESAFWPRAQSMPHDSLRSVVYRSLVPCNVPNGVVEYDTMRKSKSGSCKNEQKMGKVGTPKDSQSSVHKEGELSDEGLKEESDSPPPYQILEVSRGAQKLNVMIDSWSKGISSDGQNRDIARDLLKGALDLQESLVMLCKLQEASKYMSQTKNRQKQKYAGGLDAVDVEIYDSDRYTEKHNHREMRHGRHSLSGSSRSRVEELKNVIRDSLTRQNLLAVPSSQESVSSLGGRKLSDFCDIPSTSSSQSTMVHSNNSTSVDWSVSSTSKESKAKSPSVIGKLMGLDNFPSETSPFPLKQSETKNNLDSRRLTTDIEMPNTRMSYFLSRKYDPGRKTLPEIIETMHLKGLLKGHDDVGLDIHQHHSSHIRWKHRLDDEPPPVVLIKPLELPHKRKSVIWDEISSPDEEGYMYNFSEGEGELEPKELHNILETKDEPLARKSFRNEEPLNHRKMSNTVETIEIPTKKSIRDEAIANSKELSRKQEVKDPKSREKALAYKVKLASAPLCHKPQEKEGIKKKVDKVQKVIPSRKLPMQKNVKSATISRSPDKVTATSSKSASGQIITKNLIQHPQSTTRKSSPIRSIQGKSDYSFGQAKKNTTRKAKPVKGSMPTSSYTKTFRNKHNEHNISRTNQMENVSAIAQNGIEAMAETGTSQFQISDHCEEHPTSLCEIPTENSQHGSSFESTEIVKQLADQKTDMEETSKNEISLNRLLSSNPLFHSRAEELFELHMNQHTTSLQDVNMIDTRLFLDCANELMESKSCQIPLAGHPLFSVRIVSPRNNISLKQLLEEVCHGFDKLKSNVKVVDDIPPVDTIRKMLESDIKRQEKSAISVWETGWQSGFSVNEADQVLGEIEKQVLNELIEEVIVEYCDITVQGIHS